jgi:hypothetical protein
MKKFFSFIAIVGIILASNCSRIPENNDAVIGIWANSSTPENGESSKGPTRFEWIFNDAYLGRYHVYENGNIVVTSDFKWTQEDGIYTISYPGMDKDDDLVSMEESAEGTVLQDAKGTILAIRE